MVYHIITTLYLIVKYLNYCIMKVKNFINGLFQGRHNNLIFYTRGDETYVRRYAIPGKKRKWEIEGRSPKQRAVAIRFKAVQVFYMTFAKQVSPDIWRIAAKAKGRYASNMFFSKNFHCFGDEGEIVDFENFMFTDGSLPLPRNLEVSGAGPLFKVTWQEERTWKTVAETDRLQIGVLYDNDPRIPRVAIQVKGRRGELHGEFALDASIGKKAHVYIFFRDETGTKFSASQHVHVEINSL